MKRLMIKDLFAAADVYGDKEVTVCGWAKTIRDSKVFGFIELNDGSCFKSLQIVFEQGQIDNFDEIAKLNVGSALVVKGKVVLTPQNKQPLEVKATEILVEGKSTPDYPLQKKRHSVEFLREIAHLRPRTNLISAVMRVRSEAAFAIHSFFHKEGFVYVHTPLITASDCEGAGEMFKVTTFDLNNVPKTEDGQVDYSKDFRSHVPRRKIQHAASRGGILDDRTGNRFCRSRRRHDSCRKYGKIRYQSRFDRMSGRNQFLQQFCG